MLVDELVEYIIEKRRKELEEAEERIKKVFRDNHKLRPWKPKIGGHFSGK